MTAQIYAFSLCVYLYRVRMWHRRQGPFSFESSPLTISHYPSPNPLKYVAFRFQCRCYVLTMYATHDRTFPVARPPLKCWMAELMSVLKRPLYPFVEKAVAFSYA